MSRSTSVAIVGIGGVFPGSPDLQSYWSHIAAGRSLAREAPRDRWILDVERAYDPAPGTPDKVYSTRGCFVEEEPRVNFTPLEIDRELVQRLDPMFRLLLSAGQQAFRDAKLHEADRSRAGVIIGNIALPTDGSSALSREVLGRTFEEALVEAARERGLQVGVRPRGTGVLALNRFVTALPAGILAKALGLRAGSLTLDAACASSLYAVKLACDELLSGRADVMLSGGLSRPDPLYTQMGFSQLRAISPTGLCSPFDRKANGLVVGEGAGILVLKRTADAVRDGDRIYATIEGWGLSNDIGGSLLAPNSEGQLRAMRTAYERAGWHPTDVDLIECHATGTPLGDGVEFASLASLWADAPADRRAVIGSVKSNIGHLLTAAGSAAMLKAIMAMRAETLPPTANFESPNENVPLEGSPFDVLDETRPWSRRGEAPRRAAVSAFGFGGINAHVLLEEWVGNGSRTSSPEPEATLESRDADGDRPGNAQPTRVAIVGMDVHIGPWKNLREFRERVLGGGAHHEPRKDPRWWGAERSKWLRESGLSLTGHYIHDVSLSLEQYRIPPKEVEEMLPQQILVLDVMAKAVHDAGLQLDQPSPRGGVFVGVGLDLNTTNFTFRWMIERRAREWAAELGLNLSDDELTAWIRTLRDDAGPSLTANRTMGALASIAASRIAREFRLGGPSITVSAEECSGARALEMAVRALQQNEIDFALVAAVDLAGDLRSILGTLASRQLVERGRPAAPADGAVAMVLRRADEVSSENGNAYATIDGVGMSLGDRVEANNRAFAESGIDVSRIAFVEGDSEIDVRRIVGDSGAASSLAGVARCALALSHGVLPTLTGVDSPRYWLHDRAAGPRHALSLSESTDGNESSVVLSSFAQKATGRGTTRLRASISAQQPLGERPEALFVVRGETSTDLADALRRLAALSREVSGTGIEMVARAWFAEHPTRGSGPVVGIVSRTADELAGQIDFVLHGLESGSPQSIEAFGKERLFYADSGARADGRLAFVYPGSGNHFAGMGRDLSMHWPDVFRAQDRRNGRLRSQYKPEAFWSTSTRGVTAHDAIFGQVAFGTAMTDLLRSFGLSPDVALGYSLGETAALLSLGAWQDRDGMLSRMESSTLFTEDLAGRLRAARALWNVDEHAKLSWLSSVVKKPASEVIDAIGSRARVYLLLVNTPGECVIGGERSEVERVLADLEEKPHPVEAVSTVHCPVVGVVEDAYRDLHLLETTPPAGIAFYSGASGEPYDVTRDRAAEAILRCATGTVDFTRLVERAWDDGVRTFVEIGPGASCSRMIPAILGERPHLAKSASLTGVGEVSSVLRLLACLTTRGVNVDLERLYGSQSTEPAPVEAGHRINIPVGGAPYTISTIPEPMREAVASSSIASPQTRPTGQGRAHGAGTTEAIEQTSSRSPVVSQTASADAARLRAHESFLRFSDAMNESMSKAIEIQMKALGAGAQPAAPATGSLHGEANHTPALHALSPPLEPALFDRGLCMEIAVGSIAKVLGPEFAEVDTFPTRVRLPDEPLMLVDRIMELEGEPRSMTHGRVVTEHDVREGAWYLDTGSMITAVAVESGQADLFLSGYLGIDFITRGLAMYRLLDAVVTFHGELPKPGSVIRYDIRLLHFFKQGDTHLFRFEFDGTIDGRQVITMRKGCAGFFTPEELGGGQGLVQTTLDLAPMPGVRPDDWVELVPMAVESYDDASIDELRSGNLAACFGQAFDTLPLRRPVTLPAHERLHLVDRVVHIDPNGGRFGIGLIRAELDIHPDDWFLTCHFSDDQVMPGTLMFECCLHTFRIFLLRMGWIGEEGEVAYQPIPEIGSQLKCRGQVIASTKKVTYEVSIKEVGYRPEPYAIANAVMYADAKPVVEVTDMTVRLAGLTREGLEAMWRGRAGAGESTSLSLSRRENSASLDSAKGREAGESRPVFTREQILAYTEGNPSEAFGSPFKVFDDERVLARLPRAPFCFIDQVNETTAEAFVMQAGGTAVAEYLVPEDEWYFEAHRSNRMPFAVLLEIALQPCGWLSCYLGSALTSPVDLSYRNLGGSAVQHRDITRETGLLTTHVKSTRISATGGMIIQDFELAVSDREGVIYEGTTNFGFFTKQALANQVGVRDAKPYVPSSEEAARGRSFPFPATSPFPLRSGTRAGSRELEAGLAPRGDLSGDAGRVAVSDQDVRLPLPHIRMVDHIDLFVPDGGPAGLGFIRGIKKVDPEDWFFEAHFYQDPVCPGSLGLESFIQILEVVAAERWEAPMQFGSVALGSRHHWAYRGQIVPSNDRVVIEAVVTGVDDRTRTLTADGFLSVDGKIIYQMNDFSIRI
jgi:acyl transferase domain-containing protein/3-hydroxymyristoyl/3-hydroxydecanoyl-(acyl carrier protein) dehydratase